MIVRFYKRLNFKIRRWYVSNQLKKRERKYKLLSSKQSKGIQICKALIADNESDLFMAPISGAFYIRKDDIFCKIEYDRILIINGKYSYDIDMHSDFTQDLRHIFSHSLESRRRATENEIIRKVDKSLDIIYQELIEDKKPSDI